MIEISDHDNITHRLDLLHSKTMVRGMSDLDLTKVLNYLSQTDLSSDILYGNDSMLGDMPSMDITKALKYLTDNDHIYYAKFYVPVNSQYLVVI